MVLAKSQEAEQGADALPATLNRARRVLAGLLGHPSGDSAAAHALAAQVERLGSSRRKDERIREHLGQVIGSAVNLRLCNSQRPNRHSNGQRLLQWMDTVHDVVVGKWQAHV